jgi:hypothetical protein
MKAKKRPSKKGQGIREGRTPRLRYIESPGKKYGSPFFAVRIPRELLAAYKRYAKEQKTTAPALVRAHMSRVTGVDA